MIAANGSKFMGVQRASSVAPAHTGTRRAAMIVVLRRQQSDIRPARPAAVVADDDDDVDDDGIFWTVISLVAAVVGRQSSKRSSWLQFDSTRLGYNCAPRQQQLPRRQSQILERRARGSLRAVDV